MKLVRYLIVLIILIFFQCCASMDESTRKRDKFSLDKKYALVLFECASWDIAERTTEALRKILLDYGFNIIDKNEFAQLLKKKNISEKDLIANPPIAMNTIKDVDALIIGKIELEKGSSGGQAISTSGTGSMYTYIKECNTFVFDLTSAGILTNVNFSSAALSQSSSTFTPEQVADKIARKLSPH